MYKALKVGGKFALVYSEKNAPLFWQVLDPKVKESFDILPHTMYESIALKCGFEVEYKSVEQVKYTFTNIEEFVNWVFTSVNINPDATDQKTLKEIQETFGSEAIGLDWIRVTFVFKKCWKLSKSCHTIQDTYILVSALPSCIAFMYKPLVLLLCEINTIMQLLSAMVMAKNVLWQFCKSCSYTNAAAYVMFL